ncbi:FtsW/RodA/SpoVE family cell cycle protein [Metabacillus sp. 84]|uniref:FtsW/RodA/SpoVE family cell cycle protein n=1 Tax=unclassified Metabacillus TaxID=2675274 RepID=UPI003CEBD153
MEKVSVLQRFKESFFDNHLLLVLMLIMCSSFVAIYSAQNHGQYTENFLMKQMLWFAVGAIIMAIVLAFDFEQIERLTPFLYGFGILLLVLLLLAPESIAKPVNGAKAWFQFPGIGSIQPSEYMKIFLILMLSYMTKKHSETYGMGRISDDLKYLVKAGLLSGMPIVLILLQNDFGTSLVILVITGTVIFVSGINWRIIGVVITAVVSTVAALVILFIYKIEWLLLIAGKYQIDRIYAWLDPERYGSGISYQLKQSITAIGSGTISGKGFGNAEVYIPEAHSDFIFTMIGEEFGFFGACVIVCLYFILIYRIVIIGFGQMRNMFELFICVGMIGLFMFHVFQNIGMVIGLLPITGIPLPLMSYGGSSVLATMFGLGLVLNVSFHKRHSMFSGDK